MLSAKLTHLHWLKRGGNVDSWIVPYLFLDIMQLLSSTVYVCARHHACKRYASLRYEYLLVVTDINTYIYMCVVWVGDAVCMQIPLFPSYFIKNVTAISNMKCTVFLQIITRHAPQHGL
jgi:hypothetical protein